MAVLLSPVGGVAAQFFTNAGVPLSGGKIYTYAAGTSTPQATYTTNAGNIQHSNPIVLNSAGRVPTGEIWLTDGSLYKFVIYDANDVLIATYDNITGINSNFVNYTNQQEIQTATAGQTVFTLTTMQYQPGTNNLSVFVDGVNQYGPGASYAFVETSSTVVTFVSGLHVGAEVKFSTSQLQNAFAEDASQVTYTYPEVNGVQQNVQTKLAEYVSVKDFGAKGDGVADDTAAIQAALDSATQTKAKKVIFPFGTYRVTSTITVTPFIGDGGFGQRGTWALDWDIDFGSSTILADGISGSVFHILTDVWPNTSRWLRMHDATWGSTDGVFPDSMIYFTGGNYWGVEIYNHRQLVENNKFIHLYNDSTVGQPGYCSFKDILANAKYTIYFDCTTAAAAAGMQVFDNFIIENVSNANTTDNGSTCLALANGTYLVNASINKIIVGSRGHGILDLSGGAFIINSTIKNIYSESKSTTAYGVAAGLISTTIDSIQFVAEDLTTQLYLKAVVGSFSSNVNISNIRVAQGNTVPYNTYSYKTIEFTNSSNINIYGFSPTQAQYAFNFGNDVTGVKVDGCSFSTTLAAIYEQALLTSTGLVELKTFNSNQIMIPFYQTGCILRLRAYGNRIGGGSDTLAFYFKAADNSFSCGVGQSLTTSTSASFKLDAEFIIQPDGSGGLRLISDLAEFNYNGTSTYASAGRNADSRIALAQNKTIGLYLNYTNAGAGNSVSVDGVYFEIIPLGLY